MFSIDLQTLQVILIFVCTYRLEYRYRNACGFVGQFVWILICRCMSVKFTCYIYIYYRWLRRFYNPWCVFFFRFDVFTFSWAIFQSSWQRLNARKLWIYLYPRVKLLYCFPAHQFQLNIWWLFLCRLTSYSRIFVDIINCNTMG